MPLVQGFLAGVAVQSDGCRMVYPWRGETKVAANTGTDEADGDTDCVDAAETDGPTDGVGVADGTPPTSPGAGRPRRSIVPAMRRTPIAAAVATRIGRVMSGNLHDAPITRRCRVRWTSSMTASMTRSGSVSGPSAKKAAA